MPAFFFYSNNSPDAKVILNRNTDFELDISDDVINFNCGNDISSLFGNFTITIDNTGDKHVDRFGVVDMTKMSSVEIFVKSNVAYEGIKNPKATNPTFITVKEGRSLNSIIDDTYGLNVFSPQVNITQYKDEYIRGIINLNPGTFRFIINGTLTQQTISTLSNFDAILDSGQTLKLPPIITHYKRIFLGVVLNVAQSFQAGSPMTIVLTGESIGYWLKASTVNIHPALNEIGSSTSTQPTVFANKYSNQRALDIFQDLIRFSSNDTLTVADFSLGALTTSYENINTDDSFNQVITDELGQPFVDPITSKKLTLQSAFANAKPTIDIPKDGKTLAVQLNLLEKLKASVKNGTLLSGQSISDLSATSASSPTTSASISDYQTNSSALKAAQASLDAATQNAAVSNPQQQQIIQTSVPNSPAVIKANSTITNNNKKVTDAQAQVNQLNAALNTNSIVTQQIDSINMLEDKIKRKIGDTQRTNQRKMLADLGIIEQWKQIFSNIVLEVADASYLGSVYPFKMNLQPPQILDGDYVNKATLGKQISDALMFEFYMDTNGHFILKPPLYNINIPNDDQTYIIEEEDILSMNINDGVEGIITRTTVTGDVRFPVTLERGQTLDIHVDFNLVKKYGVHNVDLQNLIFLRTPQDCRDFGEAYMAKNNQELASASVTVMGRPDIRLGVACYLKPRDTVYYIKSITHDFSVGGEYTTTLNLIGARRIVTGFRAESTVNTVTRTNIGGIDIRETSQSAAGKILHYITANSTALLDIISQTSNIASDISVIKNSYIIISHPNAGFVGLIVDQNSTILNDINKNVFGYILKSTNQAITQPLKSRFTSIQSQFGKNVQPFQTIQDFLLGNASANPPIPGFLITHQLATPADVNALKQNPLNENPNSAFDLVGQKFTQAVLNQFFSEFINFIQGKIEAARTTSNLTDLQNFQASASYFFQMSTDAGAVGTYRPYTDQDGREYPITLNYGQGLVIENSKISGDLNSAAQAATQTQGQINSQVQQIIDVAKQNNGINSSQASVNKPAGTGIGGQGGKN